MPVVVRPTIALPKPTRQQWHVRGLEQIETAGRRRLCDGPGTPAMAGNHLRSWASGLIPSRYPPSRSGWSNRSRTEAPPTSATFGVVWPVTMAVLHAAAVDSAAMCWAAQANDAGQTG